MQTFLPYDSFVQSAQVLDNKRLGKQRVETLQILHALSGKKSGWINHPAVKMWKGYEEALRLYGIAICSEWKLRGFKDTCLEKISAIISPPTDPRTIRIPWWLGNTDFHTSHKSNLMRKFPEHYTKYWCNIPNNLPYIWPIK
jgi:hypothetical protein